MWELDHKEDWAPKNLCFWTVVLGKTLESLLDCKEIKSVNSKGNQPGILIARTDAEAEAPVLWLRDAKSRLIGKDPNAWKDWGQEERGGVWQKMRWFDSNQLNVHEFEQTWRDSEWQESLACCRPWLDLKPWLHAAVRHDLRTEWQQHGWWKQATENLRKSLSGALKGVLNRNRSSPPVLMQQRSCLT